VAFNGQGQWRQKSWEAFQKWVEVQQKAIDQRLHLLRFKSAVSRRRLSSLLAQTPPVFTSDVQETSSFAVTGDDNLPPFKGEWKLRDVSLAGPTIIAPHQKPKESTGKEVIGIKSLFYREIRAIEYVEHLIQKTRYEIEQIENEIYWLECSEKKLARHFATVNTQFNDVEFSDSLIKEGSLIRLSLLEDAPDALVQKHKEGQILLEAYEKDQKNPPLPQNLPTLSTQDDYRT